jgi:hypothetical protein
VDRRMIGIRDVVTTLNLDERTYTLQKEGKFH